MPAMAMGKLQVGFDCAQDKAVCAILHKLFAIPVVYMRNLCKLSSLRQETRRLSKLHGKAVLLHPETAALLGMCSDISLKLRKGQEPGQKVVRS